MRYLLMIGLMASMAACNNKTAAPANTALTRAPACIKEMVKSFENEPKQNPPRKVFRYTYKGQQVYYVTAICCDMYSDLYDNNCVLLGHPDGGITGKGDGKVPDFNEVKKDEQLVWEDKR